MQKNAFFVSLIAITMLSGTIISNQKNIETKADNEMTYNARYAFELSRARFPNSGDIPGIDFGINWQYDVPVDLGGDFDTYGRLQFSVDVAGTYNIGIDYYADDGAGLPVKVYVNGALALDEVEPGSWTLRKTHYFPLTLSQGENIVIMQFTKWCSIQHLLVPEGVRLVQKDKDGTYYAYQSLLQATKLVAYTKTIHDYDAKMITGALQYNNSPDYMSYAEFEVTPEEDDKSIDLHYYLSNFATNGDTGIMMSVNGGAASLINLEGLSLNTETTQNISNDTLLGLGFDFTKDNTIRFYVDSANNNIISLDTISFSSEMGIPLQESKSILANELKNEISINGRSLSKDGAIPFDWSASGFEFVLSGGGDVKATINTVGGANLVVEIDKVATHVTCANGLSNVKLASGLSATPHTIRVIKSSEAVGSLAELTKLTIAKDSTISKVPQKQMKFEFIGDSITCGNQIDFAGTEDAYMAYPRILSDAYNADMNCISVSGRGLMAGWNSESNWALSRENELNTVYNKTSFARDNSGTYDHSSYVPDVLVINVGNNDLGPSTGVKIEEFTTEVKRFHKEVRGYFPNAQVLWLYGAYVNRLYETEFQDAIDELAITDSKVDFIYLPLMTGGRTGHPSISQHQTIAEIASNKISSKLGLVNPMALPTFSQRVEAENTTILGTSTTKASSADWETWSNKSYVGDITPTASVTSADKIANDGSNLKLFSFNYDATENGYYTLNIGYATQVSDAYCYARVDSGEYQRVELLSTGGWATIAESSSILLEMAKGEHKITITGPALTSSWANYDYFELRLNEIYETVKINAPTSGAYVIEGLSGEIKKGDGVSFKVNLTSNYTQSTLIVKANGVLLNKVDGNYTINNIQEDVTITIEGIVLNKFVVTFKDGDVIYSQTELSVGDAIVKPEDPTKDGYTFVGWDISVPETMPNGNITFNAVWQVNEATNNLPLIIGLSSLGGALLIGGGLAITIFFARKKKVTA